MDKDWRYVSVSAQLHKTYDKDIIEEAKRRKEERGTALSKTLRTWIRIGYHVDMGT